MCIDARPTHACRLTFLVKRRAPSFYERLERRVLLSGAHTIVISHLLAKALAPDKPIVVPDRIAGKGAILESSGPAYTVAGGTIVPGSPPIIPVTGQGAGLHILLEEGPNLRANSAASDAFARAAGLIESIFSDPITIVIDAEITPLAGGIIGQTSSVEYHFDSSQYDVIRDLLINDSVGNEDIVTSLPTGDQFNAILPSDPSNPFSIGGLTVTRANLLALNMPASALENGPNSQYDSSVKRDMSMTFNSRFPFDYNPADGIAPGKIDFTGVVLHEIAHGMGFDSAVDDVDYLIGHGYLDRTLYPTTLDLFRLRPGDGALDFSNTPRVLAPGNLVKNQVFYDGGVFNPQGINIPGLTLGDIPLSTGQIRGDKRQASHWKDDSLTNATIGVMDPSTDYGQMMNWSDADTRALGLIGWNVVSSGSITGSLFNDANANGKLDAAESTYTGARVYIDTNRDGVFEPSERSTLTDGLGNYLFDNLTAGDYIIRAVPQSGAIAETSAVGFAHVTLDANQSVADANLALFTAATPAPWQGADLGSPMVAGTDAFNNGAFQLSGSAAADSSSGDALHLVSQSLTGDGSLITHINTLDSANPQAHAGILMRDSLDANSASVFLSLTRTGGAQILVRSSAGAPTQVASFYNTARWLRISRTGNVFRFYRSWDGIHWGLLAARTIQMSATVFAGLAISSADPTSLATAGFSNVAIKSNS